MVERLATLQPQSNRPDSVAAYTRSGRAAALGGLMGVGEPLPLGYRYDCPCVDLVQVEEARGFGNAD